MNTDDESVLSERPSLPIPWYVPPILRFADPVVRMIRRRQMARAARYLQQVQPLIGRCHTYREIESILGTPAFVYKEKGNIYDIPPEGMELLRRDPKFREMFDAFGTISFDEFALRFGQDVIQFDNEACRLADLMGYAPIPYRIAVFRRKGCEIDVWLKGDRVIRTDGNVALGAWDLTLIRSFPFVEPGLCIVGPSAGDAGAGQPASCS